MRSGIVVKKVGMTSIFDTSGSRVPVTLLQAYDCIVVEHKTLESHGYQAAVLGYGSSKKISKPQRGYFAKHQCTPVRHLREFRGSIFPPVGSVVKADYFKIGGFVDCAGVSIGKGFAGVMKRHNFGGLEATHGVSISHRSHGSTGQCQDPGKVFKNKKMAGHLGAARVTVQNLKIIDIILDKNLIVIKGSVPSHDGADLILRDAVKKYSY